MEPGEGPGGPAPPYFETKPRPEGLKKVFSDRPPPPLSQGLYDRAPLLLSEDLDSPLEIITQLSYLRIETTFTH